MEILFVWPHPSPLLKEKELVVFPSICHLVPSVLEAKKLLPVMTVWLAFESASFHISDSLLIPDDWSFYPHGSQVVQHLAGMNRFMIGNSHQVVTQFSLLVHLSPVYNNLL